jgi:hypothetical protein
MARVSDARRHVGRERARLDAPSRGAFRHRLNVGARVGADVALEQLDIAVERRGDDAWPLTYERTFVLARAPFAE